MKFIKRIRKNSKGSITIFVLTSLLFMMTGVVVAYIGISNNKTNQNKIIEQIKNQYVENSENNVIEQTYNDIVEGIKEKDGKITLTANTTDWTNGEVIVTIEYGSLLTENRKAGFGTANIENATTITVTTNGTVYAQAEDKNGDIVEAKLDITNIDKELPTVDMVPNGGTYTMPTQGTATIKSKLTAEDTGGSGLDIIKYAWSTNNITEPATWIDFNLGQEVSKKDCTQGTYYLWTKVIDVAGNRAESIKVSEGFVVGNATDTANMIKLIPDTDQWTNQEIVVTVEYGKNLTQNRQVKFEDNIVENGTTITVSQNGIVYAQAEDIAGNKITADIEITCIDKNTPEITLLTNENTTWAKTSNVEVKINDEQSGLKEGASIKYGWSTSSAIEPPSYTQANLNYNDGDKSYTFMASSTGLTGKYYLWVVPISLNDQAGNSNTNTYKTNGTFYLDNTVPSISVSETSTSDGIINVSIDVTDQQAINYILLPDKTIVEVNGNTTHNISYSISQEGEYEFKVVDMAGNEASTVYNAVFQANIFVNSLSVNSPASGTYKTGEQVTIMATFNENVYADANLNNITASTAIPLKIKFGDGTERTAMFSNINGATITYTYIIQDGDNGLLYLSSYTGTIYNSQGMYANVKAAELTGNTIIADTQGPTVESIQVISNSGTYDAGTTIDIRVTYNENVYYDENQTAFLTSTAPILKVKFDDNIQKTAKFENVSGNVMNYSYIISQEDSGKMQFVEYRGTVYDMVGNRGEINLTTFGNTGNEITAYTPNKENAEVGEIVEDSNKTITGDTPNYKNPVIPVGYAPIETPDATWNVAEGTDYPEGWNNGLVIQDIDKNQYVWVPVDGVNVRYEANYSYPADYDSNAENTVDRSVPDGVINQEAQIERYGGYYIARYEAGDPSATSKRGSSSGTTAKPVSRQGVWPYTYVDRQVIKEFSETAYNSDFVQSGLVTGTQWDTMCLWISSAGYNVDSNSTSWGNYTGTFFNQNKLAVTGSNDKYKAKNIYDVAGNAWELSSEWYKNDKYPYIKRGGSNYFNINRRPAAFRECIQDSKLFSADLGFRVVLYIY